MKSTVSLLRVYYLYVFIPTVTAIMREDLPGYSLSAVRTAFQQIPQTVEYGI